MQQNLPPFEQKQITSPHPLSPFYGSVLLHWEVPEHEPLELGPRSRIVVIFLLIAIVAWALYTNSPLMAITFILVGVIGYLSMEREPEIVNVFVTTKGIVVGKKFYEFDDIESFHFYDQPPFEDLLSLQTNGRLVSHVHIPIVPGSVEAIHETLSQFIPQDKHEPSLVDTLEKLLHI